MNDSIPYYFNVVGFSEISADTTLNTAKPVSSNTLVEFLDLTSVKVSPEIITNYSGDDFITYVLLFFLGIIAVIWHFLPDRLLMIFSLKTDYQYSRTGESNVSVPGNLITGFFWLNFIVVVSFFILIIVEKYYSGLIVAMTKIETLSIIVITLLCLIMYRTIIIFVASVVFRTKKMMKSQLIVGRNIQFITGLVLVPSILFLIYSNGSYLLYIMMVTVAVLQLVRLLKILIIGKSSTMFSTFHIILYLCTLELVPILVLTGLIVNDSVM